MEKLLLKCYRNEQADEIIDFLSPVLPDVVLAGGAPRDWELGYTPKDYDFFATQTSDVIAEVSALMEKGRIGFEKASDTDYEKREFTVYNFRWKDWDCQLIFVNPLYPETQTISQWVNRFPCNLSKIWYRDGTLTMFEEFKYFEWYGGLIFDRFTSDEYSRRMLNKFRNDDRCVSKTAYISVREFLVLNFRCGQVLPSWDGGDKNFFVPENVERGWIF